MGSAVTDETPPAQTDLDPSVAETHARPEPPSLRSIYECELRFVWAVVRRAGVPDRHLEDVCHDVFVVVHRELPMYDPTRPLRPWLFAIAWQTASDFLRRAVHRLETLGVDEGASMSSDASFGPRLEAADLVEKALSAVAPERRAVLVLHELEGVPIPEVAEALGLKLNTTYSRLRLARGELVEAVHRLTGGGS